MCVIATGRGAGWHAVLSFCVLRGRAQRERLPSWAFREDVVAAVAGSPVVVVSGETGCGKTTQVPNKAPSHDWRCSLAPSVERTYGRRCTRTSCACREHRTEGSGREGTGGTHDVRCSRKQRACWCAVYAIGMRWLRAGAAVPAGRRDCAGPRRQHEHRLHPAPVRGQGEMHDRHSKRRV